MAPFLTLPSTVPHEAPGWPTGNEWVALPAVDPGSGTIPSVNVLSSAWLTLVSYGDRQQPLLTPVVEVDGEAWEPTWHARLAADWWPVLRAEVKGLSLSLRVFAAPECKGFTALLSAGWRRTGPAAGPREQKGGRAAVPVGSPTPSPAGPTAVSLGWSCRLPAPMARLFTERPACRSHDVSFDGWTGAVRVSPALPTTPSLALRPQAGNGRSDLPPQWDPEPRNVAGGRIVALGDALGGPLPACAVRAVWPRAAEAAEGGGRERLWLALHVGLNRDPDGAALAALDLARYGPFALWRASLVGARWPAPAAPPIQAPGPTRSRRPLRAQPRAAAGPLARRELPAVLRRNLLFNERFATGRCFDSEDRAAVTSRSPRYYVAAAHWSRDTLLWSLPGLLCSRPALAREVLLACFARHTRHPGEHAQYLDGSLLYPGFELDQLAAFPIALDRYMAATGDSHVAAEPAVHRAWPLLCAALERAYDPDCGLYRTRLLSTDDPAPQPFVTYSNALVCVALEAAARRGWPLTDEPAARAVALRRAMDRWLAAPGPQGEQWVGSGDGHGAALLFDEPPGSLELLAHYGFCPADDARYRATVGWIRSGDNPHALRVRGHWETSCVHAPYRWTLGWANAMWAGAAARRGGHRDAGALRAAAHAYECLLASPMDAGLACETVGEDGRPRTGTAFATCAGFLAAAAIAWLESATERA